MAYSFSLTPSVYDGITADELIDKLPTTDKATYSVGYGVSVDVSGDESLIRETIIPLVERILRMDEKPLRSRTVVTMKGRYVYIGTNGAVLMVPYEDTGSDMRWFVELGEVAQPETE